MNTRVESSGHTGSKTQNQGLTQVARETDKTPEPSGEGAQYSGLSDVRSERPEKARSGGLHGGGGLEDGGFL